jgi:hypothetical protein
MPPKKSGVIFFLLVFVSAMAVIIPASPVWGAGPAVVLSQSSGPAGTAIEVKGTSFNATSTDTSASITFGASNSANTAIVVPAVAVVGGAFSASFQVPAFPRGSYAVTVNTLSSETAAATFQIFPSIVLKTPSGQTGSQISISGNGFNAGNTISGYFDNTVVNTTTADSYGAFSNLLITIPETYKGLHTIKATDSSGPSSSVNYTVNPKISVVPAEASVGNQVNVSGSGFASSSPITFSLDNLSILSLITTNSVGSFTATALTIPIIYSGEHTLKAQDFSGSFATAGLTTRGVFNINPQSGPANTVVTVSGVGFGPGKNIIITFNGVNIGTNPPVVTSDANGNFSASLTIPGTASGTFPVAVTDGSTSLTSTFTAAATAKATQNQGTVGGNIPINGNGFNAGNTINIKYDGVQIGTATADNNGAFSAILPAPVSTAGEHKVVATDGVNSINFIFTIIPSAQANVDNGHVGTEIIISGTAFAPKGTVNIKFGNFQAASAIADGNGVFSTSFKAPAAKSGKQLISVSDGTTTFTFNFTMETTPPTAPVLLSPPKEAKADALTEFQWTPVTDPSGVTYYLEVSHDSAFSILLIEKAGLSTPKYQISEADKLGTTGQDQPYYWRVRAVDGAFNESAWSPSWTFVVGMTLPSWIWYPIGVIVVVLFFGAGFYLGRRLERKKTA